MPAASKSMAPRNKHLRQNRDGSTTVVAPWRATPGVDPPVLDGPREPHWQCRCGELHNFANRLFCRVVGCGASAPIGVQIRAKRAANQLAKDKETQNSNKEGTHSNPKAAPHPPWKAVLAAKDKEIADLQRRVSENSDRSTASENVAAQEEPAPTEPAPSQEATELKDINATLAHLRKTPGKSDEIAAIIAKHEERAAALQARVGAARPPEQQIKATERKVKSAETKLSKAKTAQSEAASRKAELEKELVAIEETIKDSLTAVQGAEGELVQLRSLLQQYHRKAGTSAQAPQAEVSVAKGASLLEVIKDWSKNQPVNTALHPDLVTEMG